MHLLVIRLLRARYVNASPPGGEFAMMTRSFALVVFTVGALGAGGAIAPASAADVKIGVNIGVPAPVVVAPAPPVVVAPPPPVFVAPGAPIYYYGNGYYTFYNGAWFVSEHHGGPWGHFRGVPPWEGHEREAHWREGRLRGGRHWGDRHEGEGHGEGRRHH
jgi:hypothetical protein